MATLLKDIYSPNFFETYTKVLETVIYDFDKDLFLSEIYDSEWEDRELKQRMRHITLVMKGHLSDNFQESVDQLLELISKIQSWRLEKELEYADLAFMFIPDFIEQFGIEYFEISVSAFELITRFTSCEFAVRPFIIRYEQKMIDKMSVWTNHENKHVRRLASEGSRPLLPWAQVIPFLKKDPTPILPILETLKSDTSEYVRKSVANSLNDISKDNPFVVIEIAKRWMGRTKKTDWIVKHACRTLLKAGNRETLQLFGFGSTENIAVKNFKLKTETIKIGEDLEFHFELHNKSSNSKKIRLEYGIYYQKKNGTLSKKVFKISEKEYEENSVTTIIRRQPFKLITTRKFYAGKHKLSLIINGEETKKIEFVLKEY